MPLLLLLLVVLMLAPTPPGWTATSPKGIWGRVTPIADNAHPNLLYNQAEIAQYRTQLLTNHQPTWLWDLYRTQIQGTLAISCADADNPEQQNGRAALTYMLEPTQAKADAIRTALLGCMRRWPNGGGVGGSGDDWWRNPNWNHSGPPTAWFFDLIQAFHPTTLSGTEKTTLKEWFRKTAQYAPWHFRDQDGGSVQTREGRTVGDYANWWTLYMLNRLPAALVSGNQEAVDFWADSGWPHDKFTFDGSDEPPAGTNRFDLVMFLLAVFPSGANSDTYAREGFGSNGDPTGWNTNCYACDADSSHREDGGGYHLFDMNGPLICAEMAYHNGMTGVYSGVPYQNMLHFWQLSADSLNQRDYRSSSLTGHPYNNRSYFMWLANRRYHDQPTITNHQGEITGEHLTWVSVIAEAVWPFFGFPVAGGTPPPPPSQDPIAWWKMEEGPGSTTVTDSSGNNHPLTLSTAPGPTFQPGLVGSYALRCNGDAGFASRVGAFTDPNYTWMSWVQVPTVPTTTATTQPLRNGSGTGTDSWGFSWSHSDGTFMQAAFHKTSTGTYVAAQIPGTLEANRTYHVATTFDGSSLKVYLNGALQATTAANGVGTPVNNFRLCGEAGYSQFTGLIDEIKIWNRPLTAAEILTEYGGAGSRRRHPRVRTLR
jgi:hypothetical protein